LLGETVDAAPGLWPRLLAEKLLSWVGEDSPYVDITTSALGLGDECVEMTIRAKSSGVASCTSEMALALGALGVRVLSYIGSGEYFSEGDTVMRLRGSARDLLLVERTLLDVLMYASGIATATHSLVLQARRANPRVRVAATRKTPPGFRLCAKLAFLHGGGDTHRWGLSDALIVKDSHVEIIGSLEEAVKRARRGKSFAHRLEVEVSRPEDALLAARLGADIIMLDNMAPREVEQAVRLLEENGLRDKVVLEASGGIGPWNITAYAVSGVDVISTSYPFYHPERIDLSAEMKRVENC